MVESAALEKQWTNNGPAGSNPAPSANYPHPPLTNYFFVLDCFVGVVYNENRGKGEGIGYMPVKNCSF